MLKNKIRKIFGLSLILLIALSIFNFPKKSKYKLDMVSKSFYKYARYLFTKNEKKIFLGLPDKTSRENFIKVFWEIRDPNPNTSDNEFKLEMEERFEYVKIYLKEGNVPGWKTDRGRIYILLGSPHSKEERYYPYGSVRKPAIYWYYQGSNIFVMFVDEKGFGTYRMNLRYTSLGLLDELEKRKYYITAKAGSGFETSEIKFKFTYNKTDKSLIYYLNSNKIFFEQSDSKMKTKFKVDILIYDNNKNLSKKTEVKTILLDKTQLLEKKTKIQIIIPVVLPVGKVLIDTIITDLLGEAVGRKHLKIKVEK